MSDYECEVIGWQRLHSCPGSSVGNFGCCQGYVRGGVAGRYIVWLTGGGFRAIEYDVCFPTMEAAK